MLYVLVCGLGTTIEPPYYHSERGPDLKEYVYDHNMPALIEAAKRILGSDESKELFDRLLDYMMMVPDRDLARHSVMERDPALRYLYTR